MRVVTLLPGATEIVAALGGAEHLVGISHECDFPPTVLHLPRVTATPVDGAAPSLEIDAQVRRLRASGRPVIGIELATLRELAPDLLITQALCEVCAVADGEVHRLATVLPRTPRVLSLVGRTLKGIWEDVRAVGRALDLEDEADELLASLRGRLERLAAWRPERRQRVLCIEWLDPLYFAGHWVPEMVEAAGGEDVAAAPGSHSRRSDWTTAESLRPALVVIMLCGFGVKRAQKELERVRDPGARRLLQSRPVWILDGNAYSSRPGPRVVDGAERLRAALDGREMSGLVRWQAGP